jgi:hypothetical protein
LPIVHVDGALLDDVINGRRIPASEEAEGMARAIGPDGDLVALLEAAQDGGLWHPKKVFGR